MSLPLVANRTTQFGPQYAQDVSVLSNTSISGAPATMMGGLSHTVVPSTAYYEPHHLSGNHHSIEYSTW